MRYSLAILAILFLATAAFGQTQYAGMSNTGKDTLYTTATITVEQQPVKATCYLGCQSIGWVVLWDHCTAPQTGCSEQFVEAGVGWVPRNYAMSDGQVALWWASKTNDPGGSVALVPIGTPVKVEIQKTEGSPSAVVKWSWTDHGIGYSRTKSVSLPHWIQGYGIHPTKWEGVGSPSPVSMHFSWVSVFPGDQNAFLQSSAPYYASGTLTDFRVVGP